MKKLGIVLMIAFVMAMFAGCNFLDTILPGQDPVIPVETLSANIEIINWVQDEGEIELTYELTNTGTVAIAYYKVQFEVTYADGTAYIIWFEKAGIAFAGSEIVEILIEVSEEVARVDIMDLELTEWKF